MSIYSYLIDDEMLLFSQAQQCLYRLNSSGAFLWCCREEGLSEEAIIEEMVEAFSIGRDQAEADLVSTLSEWRLLGLEGADANPVSHDEAESVIAALDNAGDLPPVDLPDIGQQAVLATYRVLDQIVEVCYADTCLLETAGLAIAPLMEQAGTTVSPKHRFLVARVGSRFVIQYEGRVVDHGDSLEELPPLLLAQVMARVYLDTPCLLGIHAAALCRNGACVIMPAVSGSGKSTLAAALAASGYEYCTDELVVVRQGSRQILAAPVGMGIKSGSWAVLQRFYAGLDDLPVCPRPDGKQVRYLLAPSPLNSPLDNDRRLHALVFPQYRPQSGAELEPISTAEAICRLTDAGYDVAGGLNRETVEELIEWLSDQPCYQLIFDDLDSAIDQMNGLTA